MVLSDLPTPALIVDVPAMERNITRMAAFFAGGACRLRPHFKAHKTPQIARRQLAAGAVGLTCATVFEAEVAASMCDDILIANEMVSPGTCDRVAALARGRYITTAVDSTIGLDAIARAARRAGVIVRVVVDVNVGQDRCGVAPGGPALDLARHVGATPGVTLAGVMGYEGHLQSVVDREQRASAATAAMAMLVATADLIRADGLPCSVVSAGGTGTYDVSGRVAGVTEIQAGSYALMDSDYGRLGLPFEQALVVMATVVSRPSAGRFIADCGHKACSKDHGHPTVVGMGRAEVIGLNDEHVIVKIPPETAVAVGDRIRMRPSHADTTINLHDVIYATDGDAVTDVWPVAARGYAEHR